jgi:hypothetical protein
MARVARPPKSFPPGRSVRARRRPPPRAPPLVLFGRGRPRPAGPAEDPVEDRARPVDANRAGLTLVSPSTCWWTSWRGPVSRQRYERLGAYKAALPHLTPRSRSVRVGTLVECTPALPGPRPAACCAALRGERPPQRHQHRQLRRPKSQFLPPHRLRESAARMAERWLAEWREGNERTGIRPAFS